MVLVNNSLSLRYVQSTCERNMIHTDNIKLPIQSYCSQVTDLFKTRIFLFYYQLQAYSCFGFRIAIIGKLN